MNVWRALALFPILTACGGDDPLPKKPVLPDPPGYYGLQVCECFVFRTDGSTDKLGVGIERTSDLGDGLTALELVYRNSTGAAFRSEFVRPTSPDLSLHEVRFEGGVPSWRLDDALPLVRWPIDEHTGTPVADKSPGTYRSGVGSTATPFVMTLRSDYSDPEQVTFRTGDTAETATGVRISYTLTSDVVEAPPWVEGPRTFVPKVGFVRYEQLDSGVGGSRTWILDGVRQLEGCPFGEQVPNGQICGLSVQ